MPPEYHVIVIPLLHWENYPPESLADLKTISDIVEHFFSFNLHNLGKDNQTLNPTSLKPLLSSRVQHISSEVPNHWNITEKTLKLSKKSKDDIAEKLKVEGVFATDYAIELVSSSVDVIDFHDDFNYARLCGTLVDYLYGAKIPFKISPHEELFDPAFRATAVVACRIILYDKQNEIDELSKVSSLTKVDNGLYFLGNTNAFNIKKDEWRKVIIPNTIVMLKPEILQKKSFFSSIDELAILLVTLHCVGKTYVISESSSGLQANLEWTSWYMDDLFDAFEKKYNIIRRSIVNIENDVNKNDKQIRYSFVPIAMLSTNPDVSFLIQKVYGSQGIDYINQINTIATDQRAQKY